MLRIFPHVSKQSYLAAQCCKLNTTASEEAASEAVKSYPAIGDLFDPQIALSKLEGKLLLEEPSSIVQKIPYAYQNLLDLCQTSSGIPWWAILIGAGFSVRMATLPLHVQFEKSVMRQIPMIKLGKESILARMSGDFVLSAKKLSEASQMHKSSGTKSPVWTVNYFIPGAMLMALNYSAFHGLALLPYQPLLECKFLWLPSLCLEDPDRLLSFTNGIFIAAIARRFIINTPDPQRSEWITSSRKIWAVVGFTAIVMQAKLPSAILLYWVSSNATRLFLIDLLLKTDLFRTSVGLVSYADKISAFEAIPRTVNVTDVKILDSNASDNPLIESDKALKTDLTTLLHDRDFELHKLKTDELRRELDEKSNKLSQDLEFCENELTSSMSAIYSRLPNSMSSDYLKQKENIRVEMEKLQKQIVNLRILDFKREFSERRHSLPDSDIDKSESDRHMEKLHNTHTELLSQLEDCERDLITISNSRELQHYEVFAKKQELLYRQKDLIRDIEFCEREILSERIVHDQ